MVEKAKVISPKIRTGFPMSGIIPNAEDDSAAPFAEFILPGTFSIQDTSTVPVRRQMTTVSQKVPVIDTSACLFGFFVFAADATRGALPIPDSFEKRPLAKPYLSVTESKYPPVPPAILCG